MMKKLSINIQSLEIILLELKSFVTALLKKWLFWIFLVFDGVALLLQYFRPEYKLPQGYYVSFAVIGFLWSSFLVYRDILQDYNKINPVKGLVSRLDLSFVEGNEYTFTIDYPYGDASDVERLKRKAESEKAEFRIDETGIIYLNNEILYLMPKGSLEINFRIENTGDLPVDILDISVGETADIYTLSRAINFSLQQFFLNNEEVKYPLYVDKNEIIIVRSIQKITLGLGANNAKFAAEFRKLPKYFMVHAKAETLDVNGHRKTYTTTLNVSSRPLVDLYVSQWRFFSQKDYLRLAGHE